MKKHHILWLIAILIALINSCTTAGGGSSSSSSGSSSLKVHFYYTGSDTPCLYAWSSDGTEYLGSWPGTAMNSEGSSWYYGTIPASSSNLIFNWSSGGSQTVNLSRSVEGWYYDETWYDENPSSITPTVAITSCTVYDASDDSGSINEFAVSTSGTYIGDTYTVTATNTGLATSFQYDTALNSTTYSGSWEDIDSEGTIDVGSGMSTGDYKYVKIKATNSAGSTEAVYKFSKIALPSDSSEMIKLGANITSDDNTRFSIWSPDTDDVQVTIGGTDYACVKQTDLGWITGVYYYEYSGKVSTGTNYTFKIDGTTVRDPYARMSTPSTNASSESSIFVDPDDVSYTYSSIADSSYYQNKSDAIVYEVHVRDFTIGIDSLSSSQQGKFGGMTVTGLTNSNGDAIGIDHLKELGITHVQLMPVYDFKTTEYNWGYDPWNYNTPEDQYASSTVPATRVMDFKELVDAFHQNGIRVVMDVVFNHTYNTSVFANITSSYYDGLNLSGCGNSIDTSNPMVNKFILDSLEYWISEYNVDGFRFDLAGVFYYNAMNKWGEEINADYPSKKILLYGEPWNGSASDSNESEKVRLGKIPVMTSGEIGAFNSNFRESIKGGNDDTTKGWMFGENTSTTNTGYILLGLQGSPASSESIASDNWTRYFAYHPFQTINYISAHDNLCLWDKITYSGYSGSAGISVDKLGMALVLTAQGIPFIHAGDEMLRTKAFDDDYTTAKNTYNASDDYNKIDWNLKTTNSAVFEYYKDLISLRKTYSELRYATHSEADGKVTALSTGTTSLVTTVKDSSDNNKLVICYNAGSSTTSFDLPSSETYIKIFDSNGTVSDATTYTGTATGDARAMTVFLKQ